MPAIRRGIMFRGCLSISHPDRYLVHVPPDSAHKQARIELGPLVTFDVLGSHRHVIVARRAAGGPTDVLRTTCTDMGAISG